MTTKLDAIKKRFRSNNLDLTTSNSKEFDFDTLKRFKAKCSQKKTSI